MKEINPPLKQTPITDESGSRMGEGAKAGKEEGILPPPGNQDTNFRKSLTDITCK